VLYSYDRGGPLRRQDMGQEPASHYLKMFILFVLCDHLARHQMKLHVQCVLGALAVFELLHLVGLFQPALEDASHALDGSLSQLVCATFVVVYSPVDAANKTTSVHRTSLMSTPLIVRGI